jgi:hypothetical protein
VSVDEEEDDALEDEESVDEESKSDQLEHRHELRAFNRPIW